MAIGRRRKSSSDWVARRIPTACCRGRMMCRLLPIAHENCQVRPVIFELKAWFHEWMAAVALAINSIASRFVPQRQILLIEGDGNTFTAKTAPVKNAPALPDVSFHLSNGRPTPSLPADWETTLRGSRVEILLKSSQVLFRSVDFPKQAADFLDGMIRAQIDRLTPWTANDAVFGWSSPTDIPNERIALMLAATSKDKIQPLVQLAGNRGAASVTAFAELPPGQGAPARLKVLEMSLQSAIGRRWDVPRVLRMTLLCSGLAAAAALMLAAYAGSV